MKDGEVAEWSKANDSKSFNSNYSWVRIPPSPYLLIANRCPQSRSSYFDS